jgi:hypothetical protein
MERLRMRRREDESKQVESDEERATYTKGDYEHQQLYEEVFPTANAKRT